MGVMIIGKLSLYLETTVFNYYFDDNRPGHYDVVNLFKAIKAGLYDAYASVYVFEELREAPEPKRSNMLRLINDYKIIILPANLEAVRLSELYVSQGIIPASYRVDSTHVAIASVYGLDYIVSYNFQHINRDKTRKLVAIVNKAEGYKEIKICSASEVLNNDKHTDR